jgi:hypothetical protein
MDILTTKKINIKLSKRTMHFTGLRSDKMAYEAAEYVLKAIKHVQNMLDFIKNNKEKALKTKEWVKEHTKGKEIILPPKFLNENQHIAVVVNNIIIADLNIPDDIDRELALFFIKLAPDYNYYQEYINCLDIIFNIPQVMVGKKLEIINFKKSMVNYNYDIGFKINRHKLHQYINGIHEVYLKNTVLEDDKKEINFLSSYDNTSDNHVNILLSINGERDQTLLIYKSGKVTHSGPNEEMIKIGYEIFMDNIKKIKEYIINDDDTKTLKLYPSNRNEKYATLKEIQI